MPWFVDSHFFLCSAVMGIECGLVAYSELFCVAVVLYWSAVWLLWLKEKSVGQKAFEPILAYFKIVTVHNKFLTSGKNSKFLLEPLYDAGKF